MSEDKPAIVIGLGRGRARRERLKRVLAALDKHDKSIPELEESLQEKIDETWPWPISTARRGLRRARKALFG